MASPRPFMSLTCGQGEPAPICGKHQWWTHQVWYSMANLVRLHGAVSTEPTTGCLALRPLSLFLIMCGQTFTPVAAGVNVSDHTGGTGPANGSRPPTALSSSPRLTACPGICSMLLRLWWQTQQTL